MNEHTTANDQPRDDLNEILQQARKEQGTPTQSLNQLIENGATPHDLHFVNGSKLSPEEQAYETKTMRLMREARERRLGRVAHEEPLGTQSHHDPQQTNKTTGPV